MCTCTHTNSYLHYIHTYKHKNRRKKQNKGTKTGPMDMGRSYRGHPGTEARVFKRFPEKSLKPDGDRDR